MLKKSRYQKGFTVLEGLLIVLILSIIGGTGYYVYHSKQQTDKTLNSTQNENIVSKLATVSTFAECEKSAGSTTQQSYPEVCVTKSGQHFTQPTNSSAAQQYFTIKEWGVRAPYSGSLTLQYTADANSQDMDVSSTQLNSGGSSICTTAEGAAGYIARLLPTDDVASNETAQQFLDQNFAASNSKAPAYSKVGDYYYIHFGGQENSCTDTSLLQQTEDAFDSIAKNLQAIPQ